MPFGCCFCYCCSLSSCFCINSPDAQFSLIEIFPPCSDFLPSLLYGSYESILTVDKEKHPIDGPIYYYLFNTLLYCLLVLHIYWWVLMYRMLVKQIQARGQLSDDVRSGKLLPKFHILVFFPFLLNSSLTILFEQQPCSFLFILNNSLSESCFISSFTVFCLMFVISSFALETTYGYDNISSGET